MNCITTAEITVIAICGNSQNQMEHKTQDKQILKLNFRE